MQPFVKEMPETYDDPAEDIDMAGNQDDLGRPEGVSLQ